VRADPAQLEQALVNLVINARDAMPQGGRVEIELLDGESADDGGGGRADQVCLAVQDNGPGVPHEHRGRVFEPFFTTKPAGRGTGLGLAMVYGIAARAGGEVRLVAAAQPGARFELWLPRSGEDTAPQAPAPAASAAPAASGSKKVLVVDDEGPVRRVITLVLERSGYEVITVGSADEALALPDALMAEVDLVVTDVLMPKMPGNELVQRLRLVRPGLRCLFMSGYPADESTGDDPFLPKPFSPDDLLTRVQAALTS
jgi:CheY-like chemotaxis protein